MRTGYLTRLALSSILYSGNLLAGGLIHVNGEFGGSNILADVPENVDQARLSAGQGVSLMTGWRIKASSSEAGTTSVQLAAGYKYQSSQPDGLAEVRWTRWPLELIVMHKSYIKPYSLGAGIQYHSSGRLKGAGSWEGVDQSISPGYGVLGILDYPLAPEFSAGIRLGYLTYQNKVLKKSYSALTMGLGITYFYSE